MSHSTVPVGTAAEAHAYLAQGGPVNLSSLHAFLSDTVLLTGVGFEPPYVVPEWGWAERASAAQPTGDRSIGDRPRARVGVLYYRAHAASGNAGFAHALADAIDAPGEPVGLPNFSPSLRTTPGKRYAALGPPAPLVVTLPTPR